MEKNYGIHGDVADIIRNKFPKIRAVGFDSISLSSFQHREEGRIAHKEFLKYTRPILIVEDMNLGNLNKGDILQSIFISPLFIENVDSLPCTIWAEKSSEEKY